MKCTIKAFKEGCLAGQEGGAEELHRQGADPHEAVPGEGVR